MGNAYRETTPTRERVCLNGLWRWQPATETVTDRVPPGNWGYFKVPGSWPGITDYMQKDCQTVHAHPAWQDDSLDGVATAWYEREITIPAEWDGRRIVSREWVEASTRPVVPDVSPENGRRDPGYGYQWWILDAENGSTRLFAGNGYGGQFVLVHPEYDIVAVFNGWNIHGGGNRSTYWALQERILPHVDPGR